VRLDEWRLQAISDLHDVFGGAITIIYLEAAGALRGTDHGRDQATAAFTMIKATSKRFAIEVRTVINTLYKAEWSAMTGGVAPPPATGLRRVAALIEERPR
jgi:hypothetical protein